MLKILTGGKDEPKPLTPGQKFVRFCKSYWKGLAIILIPLTGFIITASFGLPITQAGYCGTIIYMMALFWVTEALPLAVVSIFPMFLLPIFGILDTITTCEKYFNQSVMLFIGNLLLSYAFEYSGLHRRLALMTIRLIGVSYIKLLVAFSFFTMFVSMWITNTAATSLMLPIVVAVLKIFEDQGFMKIYEPSKDNPDIMIPSELSTCYFCAIAFSSTIGGIATIIGTATNITFFALFDNAFEDAPEVMTFMRFSSFALPLTITMEFSMVLWLSMYYLGAFLPKRAAKIAIPKAGIEVAKKSVREQIKKLGGWTFHEIAVGVLFLLAIFLFFFRAPQIIVGWADLLSEANGVTKKKYIKDSTTCFMVVMATFLIPSTLKFFDYFKSKVTKDDVPKGKIKSIIVWSSAYKGMHWGFFLLVGSGFALSSGATVSGFAEKVADTLKVLKDLPISVTILFLVIFTIVVTNFMSNVAVANIICPVAMSLAQAMRVNPMWFNTTCGLCSSFCYCLPVGTPPNLLVQAVTGMPTMAMVKAGSVITVATMFLTWLLCTYYMNIIFPELNTFPEWAEPKK